MLGIVTTLTLANYNAILWFFNSIKSRISVATLFGFVAFLAFYFAAELPYYRHFQTASTDTKLIWIESYVLDWNEKVVWMSLFIACLWLPNHAFAFLSVRSTDT